MTWDRVLELDQLSGAFRDEHDLDSEAIDHERERMTMLDDLHERIGSSPNGEPPALERPKTVTCRVEGCTNDAPRLGKYAGRCPEHRVEKHVAGPVGKPAAPKPVIEVPERSDLVTAAVELEAAIAALDAARADVEAKAERLGHHVGYATARIA